MIADPIILFCTADIYAYFTLPTLLPGFALYLFARKRSGDRIAMLASLVVTLLWGLWPVFLEPASKAGHLLSYWFLPLARILDSAAWKPFSMMTALSVAAVIGTAWPAADAIRRESGRSLLAAHLGLAVYWSLCFGLFGLADNN